MFTKMFNINAFVSFLNVYYVNKHHMKCRKGLKEALFSPLNSEPETDYCTNWNFEFAQTVKTF